MKDEMVCRVCVVPCFTSLGHSVCTWGSWSHQTRLGKTWWLIRARHCTLPRKPHLVNGLLPITHPHHHHSQSWFCCCCKENWRALGRSNIPSCPLACWIWSAMAQRNHPTICATPTQHHHWKHLELQWHWSWVQCIHLFYSEALSFTANMDWVCSWWAWEERFSCIEILFGTTRFAMPPSFPLPFPSFFFFFFCLTSSPQHPSSISHSLTPFSFRLLSKFCRQHCQSLLWALCRRRTPRQPKPPQWTLLLRRLWRGSQTHWHRASSLHAQFLLCELCCSQITHFGCVKRKLGIFTRFLNETTAGS